MTDEKKLEVYGKVNELKLMADTYINKVRTQIAKSLIELMKEKDIEVVQVDVDLYNYDNNYLTVTEVSIDEDDNLQLTIRDDYDWIEETSIYTVSMEDEYFVFKAVMSALEKL